MSSSHFQASNVFCWVTVLQSIFPLWLIPSSTQRGNSKAAPGFCSLLPWGKCLGHGKRGFASIWYHLPLFPGCSLISGVWQPPWLCFSRLLSILLTSLCQKMVLSAFLMGIFFGMNCCGSEVLVVLLLSMLLLLYVATACTANFHTVSHVKSLLTSADKFSRACSPALTEQGQESGSWAVFSHLSVMKPFGLVTFLGWPQFICRARPPRSTPTSRGTELEAPIFSNSKQHVPKQVRFKSKPRGSNPAFNKPGAKAGQWFIFLLLTCFREKIVGVLFFLAKILWKA